MIKKRCHTRMVLFSQSFADQCGDVTPVPAAPPAWGFSAADSEPRERRMQRARHALILAACLILVACNGSPNAPSPTPSPSSTVATAEDTEPYSGIAAGETVHFTGTEPFWGGQVSNGTLTYTTPENQAGELVAVERFAGRNGISFSGLLDDQPLVMAVTPGECSDGMSDRSYPFNVTLQVRGEKREGCAWTDRQPFAGPKQP
jgi:uncharacterized membrane protein